MSCQRKEKTTQKFYCLYCQQRLWRLGSSKYYLLSLSNAESYSSRPRDRQQTSLSASQNVISTNRSYWLEEFYCEEHGKLWTWLSKASDGTLAIATI